MNIVIFKRFIAPLFTMVMLGCGSKSDSTGITFVSIDVSPPSPSIISSPYQQQFTAIARDGNGNGVSGVVFTWSDSKTVSCIDSTGLATATNTFGTDTITATASGISGNTNLNISITGPPPPPTNC